MAQKLQPPQHQERKPGLRKPMAPEPQVDDPNYRGSQKLKDKVALITGGDSGIGSAVAIAYAKEGANVAIVYLNEHEDAEYTRNIVESYGVRCLLLPGDIGEEAFCEQAVQQTVHQYGRLDILVNNAAEHYERKSIQEITAQQLEYVFRTNIFSYFFMTKAALNFMEEGGAIINTTSITAYQGNPELIDYSSTKGAISTFTYSLARSLVSRRIRVNAVAPGPVWTPLIPSTFSEEDVAEFGSNTPMERPAQPCELAPSYVFLAANQDSSYVTGQVIHVNGGRIVHG